MKILIVLISICWGLSMLGLAYGFGILLLALEWKVFVYSLFAFIFFSILQLIASFFAKT